MLSFLAWYLLITLLGWLSFPLAWRLFPSLADRGFSLARPLGLLAWGFLFWLLVSLGILRNEAGSLGLTFLLVAGLGAWWLWKTGGVRPLQAWLRSNARLVIVLEVMFLLAFAAWAFVRASNPNIETAGGEKTMELAFINAILRSPAFPPHDPWLSGYSISYYHFGYIMAAMLAKATSTPGAVAHNLMLALVFALSFCGAYGILYNLLSAWRLHKGEGADRDSALRKPLLGPLFLLFVSNVAGFLEVLHRRGIGWGGEAGETNLWTRLGNLVRPNLQAHNFWTWLDILHLSSPPSQPYQWTPDRFIWWWQDSRVVQDYDLAGNFTEIIDEFPAFSYMLGDLHPHVLAMPFLLLAVAFALNLFLGGWRGETNLHLVRLPVSPVHFFAAALLLGGLAFLNTWDILTGFALLAGAYLLTLVRREGWAWKRLVDLLAFCLPLGLLAFLLYLPFYVSFSSQAGGLLPNLEYPTRGAHLWVMFGTLFPPLLAYLLFLWRREKRRANWKLGAGLALGLVLLLWSFSLLLGLLAQMKMPDFVAGYLQAQGFISAALFVGATLLRRLAFIGGLLTLLALLVPAASFLARQGGEEARVEEDQGPAATPVPAPAVDPAGFVLFMLLCGAALVLAPDYVYLRDLFGKRMNTIFKFYYQAWILWSLVAAFGSAVLLHELRRGWKWAWSALLVMVLVVGLAFPVFALPNKTNGFQFKAFQSALIWARETGDAHPLRAAFSVWSLDGSRLFHAQYPDDAAAADWLLTADPGVLAEAVSYRTYSDYSRMATYSGQPCVLGWPGHEDQWRGGSAEQGTRMQDIELLYQANNWDEASAVLEKYEIRYVVVGTLERKTYRVYELNFQRNLVPVFQSGEVVIYEVP